MFLPSQMSSRVHLDENPLALALTETIFFFLLTLLFTAPTAPTAWAKETGVTNTTIYLGGVMDLEGDSHDLGQEMKRGIDAALRGTRVQGHNVEFVVLNDFYNPETTVVATKKLIEQGIFLMLGNVGTPTAKAALPILATNKILAVGFYSGADLLRPGVGDIINFRASYVQEVTSVIDAALGAGVKPNQICAYVQNDEYGMAGLAGIKLALADTPNSDAIVSKLDEIMAMEGAELSRNNLGPVGVYRRNTLGSREGYDSLKNWEKTNNIGCRLVVTVGTYIPIANFIGYARYKGENWIFSAVSFTGANAFKISLKEYNINDKVIMTQVVPDLNSSLPIVNEARKSLGKKLGYVSLEGYIVGKMFLTIAKKINGDITRDNFLKVVRGKTLDLGGLQMDFSNDNQGSDFVLLTYLNGNDYEIIAPSYLETVFKQ